jgi:hypothetical protein
VQPDAIHKERVERKTIDGGFIRFFLYLLNLIKKNEEKTSQIVVYFMPTALPS